MLDLSVGPAVTLGDGSLILERPLRSNMIPPELLKIPFTLNVLFLLLLAISFPGLQAGSATYYIAIASFAVVGFSLLLFGGLMWRSIQSSEMQVLD